MNEGRNLRLPRTLPLGAGQEAAKTVAEHWDTIDSVLEEAHLKGFVSKDAPAFACPELTTEDLTTTDSKSYTETYVHLLAWFGYATEVYAQVQAAVLQYKNMRDVFAAASRKVAREHAVPAEAEASVKKPTEKELDQRLLLNPEYQEILHKMQRYQQAEMLYKAKVDSIERSLRVISRQVEIRKLDLEQTRTGHNMPNRGFTGGGRFGQEPGGG